MPKHPTKFRLRSINHDLLYEGAHESFKEALQQAFHDNINLTGIDASYQDLRHVNLDGIELSQGNFQNSDLMGANISEAILEQCVFNNSTLLDTCLCYSDLNSCHFLNTRFGMTDISQTHIKDCIFSGYSAFSLNFVDAYQMEKNIYLHENETLQMSRSPYVIHGFKKPLVFFDDKILINNEVYNLQKKLLHKLNRQILSKVENNLSNSTIY